MIFWATREIKTYLDKLWYYRINDNTPKHVVTIAGGLSYLHFLNENVLTLCVVDRNKDNIDYNQHIIEIIKNSSTLENFKDSIKASQENIPGIIFEGEINLSVGHYNWLFGKYAFESEETFQQLKAILQNLSITYLIDDLEKFNFNIEGAPVYVLVNNADEASYTEKDAILKQLRKTARKDAVYISWTRTINLYNNNHHLDTVFKISKYTEGRKIIEVPTMCGYNFTKEEIKIKEPYIVSADFEIIRNKLNSSPEFTLLIHLSWEKDLEKNLGTLLQLATPDAIRIIYLEWTSRFSIDNFFKLFTTLDLHASYNISAIEWAGGSDSYSRSYIVVMDLIGLDKNFKL